MRVVLDTNTLVSGTISANGPPRRLLNAAIEQAFEFCTSPTLLAELLDVLSRQKFSQRLSQAGLSPELVVADLRNIATLVIPINVPHVIQDDPDDDHVIACAIAASADLIVSGDKHLHNLGGYYEGIRIVNAADAVKIIVSTLKSMENRQNILTTGAKNQSLYAL